MLHRNRACAVEALRHSHRVDPAVQQRLGLLQQRARQHDHAGGTVADLIVLRLGELDEELADLVLDLHLLENRRAYAHRSRRGHLKPRPAPHASRLTAPRHRW